MQGEMRSGIFRFAHGNCLLLVLFWLLRFDVQNEYHGLFDMILGIVRR